MGKFAADDFASIGRRLAELEGRAPAVASGHQWEAGEVSGGAIGVPPIRFHLPVLMPSWESWGPVAAGRVVFRPGDEMVLSFCNGSVQVMRFGNIIVLDPTIDRFHLVMWNAWNPPRGRLGAPVSLAQKVLVRFRCDPTGASPQPALANGYRWDNQGSQSDIVSFAVVLEP